MTTSTFASEVREAVENFIDKTQNHNIKVYLASPWFTPKQKEVMDKVRMVLLEIGFNVFAPFYDGIVLTKENDSPEMRKKVFEIDVMGVVNCNLVVAVIDDFDPGTIFEMGVACGYKRGGKNFLVGYEDADMESLPAIIAYSDVSGRGLNVMLQKAVYGFANGIAQLAEQLRRFTNGEPAADYLKFEKGDFV